MLVAVVVVLALHMIGQMFDVCMGLEPTNKTDKTMA